MTRVPRRYASPMLPDAEFEADVVLVAPREFEVTKAQRTYREKNFTTFTELLNQGAFQAQHIQRINEALGLEALAPYLRDAGMKVAIINCNVAPHTPQEVARKILASKARVVGISMIYRPQVGYALELLEALQGIEHLRVVAGGALASYMPRELLSRLGRLDAVVFGEAEETFCDYCACILGGSDPSGLPGIAYRDARSTVMNPAAKPLDLYTIKRPERHSLAYLRARSWPTRIASIYTSRGCMAKCTFCTGKDAYNVERPITYRYRNPLDVVDEIQYLHEAFGVKFVYINDDNFLGYGRKSLDRVREFANELLERQLGIEFATECRVDAIELDMLRLLKRAGMRQVLLGVESGSDAVLTRWRKGVTADDNRRAVALCREAGVTLEPGFILFDAETSRDELAENIGFIRDVGLDRVPFPTYLVNRMSVYPGTEVEREWTEKGILGPSPIVTQRTSCPTDRQWAQLWRSGAVARTDAVPCRDDFVDDPAAVVAYFQRLEYNCANPRTEIAWRGLRHCIEPVEMFLESRLPGLVSILADCRVGGGSDHLLREIRDLIARAGAWRRDIGTLIVSMLEATVRSYDIASPLHQFRWLCRTLAAMRRRYERDTLGMDVESFSARVMDIRRQVMPMRATVVVTTDGTDASRVQQVLTSLGRQEVPAGLPWEVVLVLGGAAAAIDVPSLGDVPLRVVALQHARGRGAACNAGIGAARGETVILVDDDIVVGPRFVASHLDAQSSRPTLCHGPVREVPDRIGDLANAHDRADRGTFTVLERDGIESLKKGRTLAAWLAFAGGNLSAPRRWFVADPFDERPAGGLEHAVLAFRWWRKNRPLALAEDAVGVRVARAGRDRLAAPQASATSRDVLPGAVAGIIDDYLEEKLGIEVIEQAMASELEPETPPRADVYAQVPAH